MTFVTFVSLNHFLSRISERSEMKCMYGRELVKCLMVVFNIAFTLSGVGIIALGVFIMLELKGMYEYTEKRLVLPIVLTVTGSIVFAIAILGCCGAMRESKPMLIAFITGLSIILILELSVAVCSLTWHTKTDFRETLRATMNESMKDYPGDSTQKRTWDYMQTKWMCCGIDGHLDWKQQEFLPLSCCHDKMQKYEIESASCETYQMNVDFVNTIGCFEPLYQTITIRTQAFIGASVGSAFIEIIGIVLASWILCNIKVVRVRPPQNARK